MEIVKRKCARNGLVGVADGKILKSIFNEKPNSKKELHFIKVMEVGLGVKAMRGMAAVPERMQTDF